MTTNFTDNKMKPTEAQIRAEAENYADSNRLTVNELGWFDKEVLDFTAGAKWALSQDSTIEPFHNFWFRLGLFMDNVQVNDQASEEEKEMIQNVCLKQLNAIIEEK